MNKSSLRYAVAVLSLVSLSLSLFLHSGESTQAGYTLLTADPGQSLPVGTALFTVTGSDGTLVSQAGVGATEPITSGRVFVDQIGTEIGIAFANPSSAAASITLVLRSSDGRETARRFLDLAAGNHTAQFVSQWFPSIAADFVGSLSFESAQKVAAVTLRQSQNSRGEALYTTLPVMDLSKTPTAETVVFPQIAAGEGYSTQVILMNGTGQSLRGQIQLYGDDGRPLVLRGATGESSQFSYDIAANGTYRVEFGSSQSLRAGYALVIPEPGTMAPSGSAVFRVSQSGFIVTEAGVGASQATTSARIFVDNVGCYTGVALVNRENRQASLTFTLLDRNGTALESRTRSLPANGHMAVFAHQLFGGLGDKFTGLMEISSTAPVAPITLKLVANARGDLVYTTLPVADLNRISSATSMVFPQIAFGGGFSTRLIFISTDKTKAATGKLSFYQSNASPMNLTFGNQTGSQFPYQLPLGGGIQIFPGSTAKLASITLVDPQTGQPTGEIAVNEGNTIKVGVLALDETGMPRDDFALNYTSLSQEVATVDANGLINGRKSGFSTLTISSGGILATGTVNVVSVRVGAAGFKATGVVQDLARGVYLTATDDHAILFSREIGRTPDIYAGVKGTPGLKNDLRLTSMFRNPQFLALDQARGTLYVSDGSNNVIRTVLPGSDGRTDTFVGAGAAGSTDGAATASRFNNPQGIALDNRGYLWIVDSGNHTIRRINLSTRITETIAGSPGQSGWADGARNQARFSSPVGIAVEPSEPIVGFLSGTAKPVSVIVADTGNGCLRRVKETGEVETIRQGGQKGPALQSVARVSAQSGSPVTFNAPTAVAVDSFGNIYVSERDKGRVSTVLTNGNVVAAAQTGSLNSPAGMAISRTGSLLVADGTNVARELVYGGPQIATISPAKAATQGGEKITILGSNFSPETILVVAGTVIDNINIRDTRTLEFFTPAGLPSGLATLTVQNRSGLAQTSFLIEGAPFDSLPDGYITTFAGGSSFAGDGAVASRALLNGPQAAALDLSGNLYFADSMNNRVRRVEAATGMITTVAGTGEYGFSGDGGPGTAAKVNWPAGVAIDPAGNLYIADSNNSRIRKIAANSGIITTVAGSDQFGFSGDGGPATSARLFFPNGVAVDPAGNIYIADSFNHRVRKVAAGTGTITTIAGNGLEGFAGNGGPATAAQLDYPLALALDGAGNVYVADTANRCVRKISGTTGVISMVAGTGVKGYSGDGGPATSAMLRSPFGVSLDPAGNLFIADTGNHRIRKVAASTGTITTVAGTGDPGAAGDGQTATSAQLTNPEGIYVDFAGNLFISDTDNNEIRAVSAATGIISTAAGANDMGLLGDNKPAVVSILNGPSGAATDPSGNVYIADTGNNRIRKVSSSDRIITTVAGTGRIGAEGDNGSAMAANLNQPNGVAVDSIGNLYIADTLNYRVRKVSAGTGIITTVAGTGDQSFSGDGGAATSAAINWPSAVATDGTDTLYISDMNNQRVRRVSLGRITTVAGNGIEGYSGDNGPATAARLSFPRGLAVDTAGNLFIADTFNHRVRRVDAGTGTITTAAGTGLPGFAGDGGPASQARLNSPWSVAFDSSGNLLIADTGNNVIRRVAGSGGTISTIAGNGSGGFSGDGGPALSSRIDQPLGAVADSKGNLFLVDWIHNRIRGVRGPVR